MWSFALWLVIAWEGWFVSRGSVLTASMPSLILLGEVLYLTNPDISSLWVMLWITLLLMGLTHFRLTFLSWIKRSVDYAEIILDTTISIVFVISIVLAAMAWFIPSVPIQEIVDEIRSHSVQAKPGTKSLADSLGLKAPPKGGRRAGRGNSTVMRHVIGAGPELSRELVMTISTGELPPGQAFSPSVTAPYHRWRSYTLDRYIGTGWANTPVEDVLYESDVQVFASIPERYRSLRQNVRMEDTSNGNIYWDGILQSVNQPFEVSWRVKPETNPPVNANLLGKGDMFGAFSSEEFYQITSLIPIVDAKKLHESSSLYSDEIRTHYLLLPEGVPDRVLALAREITATSPTPYDEAQAIEKYLRKNYPYTLNIPAPPANRDVVDYFLFDLKTGFCDYYATAMVVMARAVGLPARMVFGYAGGRYDFNSAEYSVVRADAHAWVEIYFPEVGWVEFDPTAGRPGIDRQTEETPQAGPYFQPGNLGDLVTLRGTSVVEFGLWSVLIVIGLAIVVTLLLLGEFWLLTHIAPVRAMRMIYRGLFFVGRKVAGASIAGETTDEFAAALRNRLQYLSDKEWLHKSLSPAIAELNKLTDLYLRALYTQRPPSKDEVHAALRTWQTLRWRLLLANLLTFIPSSKIVNTHM
jgi:transglutaminase-like putative cysteine protease